MSLLFSFSMLMFNCYKFCLGDACLSMFYGLDSLIRLLPGLQDVNDELIQRGSLLARHLGPVLVVSGAGTEW